MSRSERTVIAILSIVSGLLAILVLRSGLDAYREWSGTGLGAPLPTSPYTPLGLAPPWTPAPMNAAGSTVSGSGHVGTPSPRCGGPPVMTLLLIGSDTRGTGYTWGLADVIRVARIGLYRSDTGERLPLVGAEGLTVGDSLTLPFSLPAP